MEAQGAEIVDDIEISADDIGDAELTVLLYEFKAGLAAYFERTNAPVKSLAEVIAFNEANADEVMPFFGQDLMITADEKGGLDSPEYLEARETARGLARARLDAALDDNQLDALVAITNGPAWKTDHVKGDNFRISSSSFAAVSGYPNVTVPAGFVFDLPVGLSLIGRPFEEQALLEIAYAFEQATRQRRPPALGKNVTVSD